MPRAPKQPTEAKKAKAAKKAKEPKQEPKRPVCYSDNGRKADGKRDRKAHYGATMKEARANRKAWENARDAQNLLDEQGLTVARWVERWVKVSLRGGDSNRSTTELYSRLLVKHLGPMKIADVRKLDITGIAKSISECSKSKVSKVRSVVQRIFADALDNNIIAKNPTIEVKWENGGSGTHRNLEAWERLAVSNYWDVCRFGIAAMLMMYAGLRRGEVIALKWSDIDFEKLEITVEEAFHFVRNKAVVGPPKSEASFRTIPIVPELYVALMDVRAKMIPGTSLVVTSKQGKALTSSGYKRAWESYINCMNNVLNGGKAFMPGRRKLVTRYDDNGKELPRIVFKVRAHDFRHTFCTLLYEAGIDLKSAMYLMGHDDEEMTLKIYTHLSQDKKQAAIKNMRDKLKI